ncbi:hypothetical protein Cp4447_01679 [Clostridium perfringens]|uniref:Uncharacterized protein n=1 Tax=Clostridium perfringens TaxID=1502 RepID=A0A2X3CDZ2_CLOPF|nr:hypothetical protein [Clostridium perfringens]MDH5061693.1 hypothetical protein [Clostridium perfringens NCTC 8239]MDG6879985.1 hypothetical protein [Clostridium perfringens]MDG6884335.1 hypothetical protein [Clostridium perfringens]MDG6886912.1 hypothetical protein [Clostridium perfringens]
MKILLHMTMIQKLNLYLNVHHAAIEKLEIYKSSHKNITGNKISSYINDIKY